MDIFDDEKEIISFFQSFECCEVAFLPSYEKEAESIFRSVHSAEQWGKWIDSSAHDAPPPDFYNDDIHAMMDVMRVDDHGYKNRKGKTVNPSRQRDTMLMQELRESGVFEIFPNAKPLVISDTGLPTERDHNYEFYRKNFAHVIESHKKKIANYKNNHPKHKVIFFVFDESSMYCSLSGSSPTLKVGGTIKGIPHLWFLDEHFLSVLIGSEIDYLIWCTPYKYAEAFDDSNNQLVLPKVVVISVSAIEKSMFRTYDTSSMISTEL